MKDGEFYYSSLELVFDSEDNYIAMSGNALALNYISDLQRKVKELEKMKKDMVPVCTLDEWGQLTEEIRYLRSELREERKKTWYCTVCGTTVSGNHHTYRGKCYW